MYKCELLIIFLPVSPFAIASLMALYHIASMTINTMDNERMSAYGKKGAT
jgi:hypothetical protein